MNHDQIVARETAICLDLDDQVRDQVRAMVAEHITRRCDALASKGHDVAGLRDQLFVLIDEMLDAWQDGATVVSLDAATYSERLRGWWNGALWGQHWAGYYQYYAAMEALGVTGLEPIHGAQLVARSAGWWWAYTDFAVITDRAAELHRDPQARLHREDGAAVLYRDGWGLFSWHGTRCPEDLIMGHWSTQDILRETNAEVRRCGIEKMGWDRFIADMGLEQIGPAKPDPGNPGFELRLFSLPEQLYDEPVNLLMCDNATPERDGTRRRFGLTVPASITDPVAAAAWTFQLNPDEYAKMTYAY